jgi:protein-S-isoprenylcysteine O-methyltransferase Ste14
MDINSTIIGACWILFFVIWIVLAIGRERGERRYAPGLMLVRLAMIAALVVAVRFRFPPAVDLGRFAAGVAAAGAALCVVGLAFASWARVALGRSWGMPMTLRDKQDLVTHGPYAYVRHPIYTGMTLMAVGTTLVLPFMLLWCAIMVAYVLISARREERDMDRLFPDTYPAYRQRSKMLIPFVL